MYYSYDTLYHKKYQDKCKTVKFMKVLQESSLRRATTLLGKNQLKKSNEKSRGNLIIK